MQLYSMASCAISTDLIESIELMAVIVKGIVSSSELSEKLDGLERLSSYRPGGPSPNRRSQNTWTANGQAAR